jgi:hypothetical protein
MKRVNHSHVTDINEKIILKWTLKTLWHNATGNNATVLLDKFTVAQLAKKYYSVMEFECPLPYLRISSFLSLAETR